MIAGAASSYAGKESRDELIVLALNCGSSSLKFGLYRVDETRCDVLLLGEAESIGANTSKFHAFDSNRHALVAEQISVATQNDVLIRITKLLADSNLPAPHVIGHRIVHGGPKCRQHCRIDDAVLQQLLDASIFAPLHTPTTLSVIRYAEAHFPSVPQIACFDTSFHANLPDVARVLPIPKELRTEGIQRYGFHGLSCESIVRQLGADMPSRLIIAHLGNGASITAVKNGTSIDTSMGLTPSGGVIMGARSGDLDPGVLIYLMREKKLDAVMLEELIDQRSGLRGISGVDGDMRSLHAVAATDTDAQLAIDMFCYSVRKQIAAMIAVLGGIDMIVFCGGIGENDALVRADICSELAWIGVSLNAERNRTATNPISNSSRCAVHILVSQEDEQIARHSWDLLPEFRC